MKYNDLILKLLEMPQHKELRRGQHLMNELQRINPDYYSIITATEHDPFYKDDRIPEFFEKLKKLTANEYPN